MAMTPVNIASAEVAAHTAPGRSTSAGAARRAVVAPATRCTVTTTAAIPVPHRAMARRANQPAPPRPIWSSAQGTSGASGG